VVERALRDPPLDGLDEDGPAGAEAEDDAEAGADVVSLIMVLFILY